MKFVWRKQVTKCQFCGSKIQLDNLDRNHFKLTWETNGDVFYATLCTIATTSMVNQICGLYSLSLEEYHNRLNSENWNLYPVIHRKITKWLHNEHPVAKQAEVATFEIKRPKW